MVNNVVIGNATRSTINSINRTQNAIDRTSLRLSTGRNVNKATDQPQNFFASRSLLNRASDFNRLLDGIGQSVRVIEETLLGIKSLQSLLNQAEAIAIESRELQRAGGTDPNIEAHVITTFPPPLSTQILANSPVTYWRLGDASSPAINLGSGGAPINGTYAGGAPTQGPDLYVNNAQGSTDFDGINDIVNIPDSVLLNTSAYPQRTVEMVFNADNAGPRQVLYEEGATTNGLTIYIDGGNLYVTGEDDGAWADANISTPINAGQTYHVAFVYNRAALSFTGYVDGVSIGSIAIPDVNFPSHSGDIGIGGAPDGVQFHDGESAAGGFFFNGRISDVAIYNTALSSAELQSHAQSLGGSNAIEYRHADFENILAQIDAIVVDANYRGINLLANEDLITDFNENRTNTLVTQGVDFSFSGLEIKRNDFNNLDDLNSIIDSVRDAVKEVRDFGRSLVNDLGIISTREEFTRNLINTHAAGADDLTIADLNEEGANQLASQTRLEMGFTALTIASQSRASILEIITGNV